MRNRLWRGVALAYVGMTATYFLLPNNLAQSLIYSGFGLATVGCILVGVWLHRPVRRRTWLALAAANAFFTTGDGILAYYSVVRQQAAPFPSIADALYLMGYPFLVVGVADLFRQHRRAGREDYVDAAILACGALAALWQVLMHSYVHNPALSVPGMLVTMAYPIMDIGVLFFVASVTFAGRLRSPELILVGAGVIAMLVADLVYDVLVLHHSYHNGSIIDVGWLMSYACFGIAALHPATATQPAVPDLSGSVNRIRLPLLASAGFITPVILLVSGWLKTAIDLPVFGAISLVLFGLVILRASWLLKRSNQQTERLRAQSEELSAALGIQRALEGSLRHQAFHDSLTGLANRALLLDRLGHALLSVPRSAGEVAVLFCDLDDFKTINDGGGHGIGDSLLQVVARRLQSVVRPGDTVARLGSDEFAVLLDAVDHPDVATATADRIVSVLRRPITLGDQTLRLSASVGVSFGHAASSAEDLLGEADAAMSAAKRAGKDQVRYFETQMRTAIVKRMELRNSFESALQHGEFYLVYQPYFAIRDRTLQGFEALVRWQHPVYGQVSPVEFIPLAEETGFIVPLGQWVLDTACAFATKLSRPEDLRLTMSVNVSLRQLRGDAFVDGVRSTLAYCGLPPEQLTLELTESMLTIDPAETARTLTDLKRLGARIAIDDFGTGYSSLSYLSQFPIDVLKIDKSFVDPLSDPSRQGAAFVGTIIGLAQQLGLSTVAEGIEDETQRHTLADLGCELAQGYLFARPLPGRDALSLVAEHVIHPSRA